MKPRSPFNEIVRVIAWTLALGLLVYCCNKARAVTVGQTFQDNRVFNGITWTTTATVTAVTSTSVSLTAQTISSAAVIRGYQVWRTTAGGNTISSTSSSGTQTLAGLTVTGTAGDSLYLMIFGQDTATDPSGGNNHLQTWVIGVVGAPTRETTIAYYNENDYPVTLQLKVGGVLVGSPITVGAKTLFGQTISIPPEWGSGAVQVEVAATGFDFVDGVWTASAGHIETLATVSVPTANVPNAGTPADTFTIPKIDTLPNSGVQSVNSGGTVWSVNTATTDVLTKPVYREGTDKISARIDATNTRIDTTNTKLQAVSTAIGTTNTKLQDVKDLLEGTTIASPVTFDAAAQTADHTDATTTPVIGALSKLPALPSVTAPGSPTTTFAWSFTPPGLSSAQTFSVDFTDYVGGITIFKAIVRSVLALWFFFLALRAIREAFAG